MKRTTISMDAEWLEGCEQRANQLGRTVSQCFRILAHNYRAEKQEGLSIVAESRAASRAGKDKTK